MSFPRYPEYKDSGVKWLGPVPGHWKAVPLKAVSTHNDDVLDESTAPDAEIAYVDISSVDGINGIKTKEDMLFAAAPSRARRRVKHGDVIVSTVRTYLKAIARIRNPEANLVVSTGFAVIRPRGELAPDFLGHLVGAGFFVDQVIARSTGVSYPAINASELVAIPVPVPPLPEQTLIAAFLDRETAKIDALVTEQRRLMELLKEKRQAVISRAVTRGLKPNAAMKPSGIEWLGDVPEHWEVMPMRMIANIVRGASPRPAGDPRFFGGDAVPWVTVGEITKDDDVYLTETEFFLTKEGATHSNLFESGTLIYSNSGATLGVPKVLSIDACANDGVVAFLNLDDRVRAEFLYHYLSSITDSIREKVKQGSGQPNLNTDIVKDLRFGLPPLPEQESIVARIAQLATEFGALTTEAQRAIDLLQERRTALISAAVTGQIDVRAKA